MSCYTFIERVVPKERNKDERRHFLKYPEKGRKKRRIKLTYTTLKELVGQHNDKLNEAFVCIGEVEPYNEHAQKSNEHDSIKEGYHGIYIGSI